MAWLELASLVFKIGLEIWKSIKEADIERKKQLTAEAQSGIRGIIDGDASRANAAIDNMRRLRH